MAENKQQQEIRDITDKLEQGVKELFESEKYKVFLHTMSKFHNYSLNNTMLIAMQMPEATLVAGYEAWKKNHERHVVKGEKGIRIFAPAPYKVKVERDKIDPVTNKPVLDENNNPVKEVVEVKKPAFKLVSVFDVSQTEGKEIPSLGVDELLGDVEDYVHFFDALERSCPVPIGFEEIEGGAKGYYHQTECRIALNEGMSEVQNVKTLIHEMAHQKLHAVENIDKDLKLSRSAKEVEAESIAYVICQHYGIDTSEYSFAYLAGWSDGKDTPELKASLDRIRKASNEMINEIDSHIAEINLELQSEQDNHITCYLKISNSMGSEYAVDRIAGTPEQIEAALREVKEAGKTDTPIENIEAFLESKGIPVLALGSSLDDEPVRLVHPEYEYDVDTNEIYRDGAALGREMTREEKALRLAISMDTMAYESDLYDYRDRVEDREEFVLGLQQDLLGDKETVFGMVEWFQELVDEETNEAEDAQKIIDELYAFMDDFEEAERYSVTETSDAFMPGEDFAIMDNETGEYVYSEDGAVITFPTKDEADRYLAGMQEDVAEKGEIVGVVSYASGEYFEYTDKEAYLRCIQTIGQLAQADTKMLQSVFGKMGLVLKLFANGEDQTPVNKENVHAPIKSIGNSTTTPRDLTTYEDVAIIAYVLSESVSARLRDNNFVCNVVEISVRDNELHSFTRQKKLQNPTDITNEIATAALELFRANYKWDKPIRSIGVRASDLTNPYCATQLSLFVDEQYRDKMRKADRAVDDIRRRFGFASIQRGLMYCDRNLSNVNAKEDHTVHPHGYMEGGNRTGVELLNV